MMAQLALGAALVAAASVLPALMGGIESPQAMEAVQAAWSKTLNHAIGEFGKQLRTGIKLQRKMEKLIADQLPTQEAEASY
jgi:hypothetical protein